MTSQEFLTEFDTQLAQLNWAIKINFPRKRLKRIFNKLESIDRNDFQIAQDEKELDSFWINWKKPRSAIDNNRMQQTTTLIHYFEIKYNLVDTQNYQRLIGFTGLIMLGISRIYGHQLSNIFIALGTLILVYFARIIFIKESRKY